MLVLAGVKRQSGMLCPGGVNRLTGSNCRPRAASLSIPGQSLVNALANERLMQQQYTKR